MSQWSAKERVDWTYVLLEVWFLLTESQTSAKRKQTHPSSNVAHVLTSHKSDIILAQMWMQNIPF